jgi:hypothetical protein
MQTNDDATDMPIACSLSPDELRERSGENATLFGGATDVRELPDGYLFTFPADQARQVMDFMLAERDCCPFFSFELTLPSPHQLILLSVRGREGVKEVVQAATGQRRSQ